MILQGLKTLDAPLAELEQYTTPAKIAAEILYTAFGEGDVSGKSVIDLGCGNGIFAIGSCLLGAAEVCAVDADPAVIDIARENAEALDCDIDFQCKSVDEVQGDFDTCVQNPPFGAQKKHADLPFLHKAIEIAGIVYSIHNARTADFIKREVNARGGNITAARDYSFEIRHSFDFHTKEKEFIDVIMFRIERGK